MSCKSNQPLLHYEHKSACMRRHSLLLRKQHALDSADVVDRLASGTWDTFSTRQKTWRFFNRELDGRMGQYAKRYEMFTALLIILNVCSDILDSIKDFPFSEDRSPAFQLMEKFTCVVFTIEYALRIWSCCEVEAYSSSCFFGRLRYALQFMPLLDALVLVVYYVDLSMSSDEVRGVQTIRMFRILSMFKMERQTESFTTIATVLAKKQSELCATLFMAAVLLVMASTAMYYTERDAQPENFDSIPSTMWWSVTAMTTVGYGDIYPITVPGKILGSIVAFLGVGIFALPSGIISSGFVEVLEEQRHAEAEEIAEMIDEDQHHVDRVREEVEKLRSVVTTLQNSMLQEQEQRRTMQNTQEEILRILSESARVVS